MSIMDDNLKYLTQLVLKFRDDRNWKQFHTGKDLAMCLNVESGELLELFLWKSDQEVDKGKLADEMGDVLYSLILLADNFDINLTDALKNKIEKNEKKYPVEEFRNSNRKYNEE